mgnify:CR=1 FL=1
MEDHELPQAQYPDENGFLLVDLYKGEIKETRHVHRLVAETFIPNPENKPHVIHKDFNKTNNRADNLEWASEQEYLEYIK